MDNQYTNPVAGYDAYRHNEGKHLSDALNRLKKAIKRGPLGNEILGQVNDALLLVKTHRTLFLRFSEFEYYKTCSMISELCFYLGRTAAAREAVEDGRSVFAALPRRVAVDVDERDRRLIAEKIRYCANWAQATLYTAHQYGEAETVLLGCRELILNGGLRNAMVALHGTIAQVQRYLGQVYRKRHRYELAEECFLEAISHHVRRAEERVGARKFALRFEHRFAFHRVALCLLSLAWIHFVQGHLARALRSVKLSRVLLLLWTDPLNVATADVLEGIILRNLARGSEDERLPYAMDLLKTSRETFRNSGHAPYYFRSTYELALAEINAGHADEAHRLLAEVEDLVEDPKTAQDTQRSWRWKSYCNGRRSRLEREIRSNRVLAETYAEYAVNAALKSESGRCLCDALLVRAASRLLPGGDVEEANSDIDEAMGKIGIVPLPEGAPPTSDRRLTTIAYCLKAAYEVRRRDSIRAAYWLQRADDLVLVMEDRRLQDLVDEKHRELAQLGSAFQVTGSGLLTYRHHDANLRRFLLETARSRNLAGEALAGALGVKRSTVSEWEKELFGEDEMKQRRRRGARRRKLDQNF